MVGLPRGSVVRNPPANAGNTGSIPDPGRCHMLRSNQPTCHMIEPVLENSEATATEACAP